MSWLAVLVAGGLAGICGAQDQGAPQPVRISGGVMQGLLVGKVDPVCPGELRMSGAVVLHAIIGTDGHVMNLQVVSGPEMLRASALDAVRQWTYKPFVLNGTAVVVDTTVTAMFRCGGGEDEAATVQQTAPGSADGAARPVGKARIAGGVMAGQILTKVAPSYPADARIKGISGSVIMHAVIAKDGQVENLTVLSGPEELRQSAIDAVSQWTYKPYLLNGMPTEVDTTITVNYNLGKSSPLADPPRSL